MCLKRKQETHPFEYEEFNPRKIDKSPSYDLVTIYEKCIEEMTLQQSKRDQIITIYVTICTLLVSYILSNGVLPGFVKGLVFFAAALIGFGFSLVIVRYRIYKEAYWICCQTITNLMVVKEKEINKETIHSLYYRCLKKRGKGYVTWEKPKKRFKYWTFFKKNIFSGETIYCLIHSFIVSILFSLSLVLILPCINTRYNVFVIAAFWGVITFVWQVYVYFKNLKQIYNVLVDGTSESFNIPFSKAWFLHLYID